MAITGLDEVCQHGRVGFCYDDLKAAQQGLFDFLHAHAFDFALAESGSREQAEQYAGAYAQAYCRGTLEDAPAHPDVWRDWTAAS